MIKKKTEIALQNILLFAVIAVVSGFSHGQEPTLRMIESNGINMRIAEMGEGPLVILVHGWPESWYSWRHQLKALADAGYHAVEIVEKLRK